MHTKAITKADVWNHVTKLGSLHSVQAGTIHRAKTICFRICLRKITSSSSAFTGPDDFVYKCQSCQYVESDVTKLQYNIGVSVIFCCAMCSVPTEVIHIPRFEYLASRTAMASSLAPETPLVFERTPSPILFQSSPMTQEEEEAIDDDVSISAAAHAADNPISAAA